MNQKQLKIITIGCFLSYFLFGFIDNIKGPTLPAMLMDVGYKNYLTGTIIAAEYLGFFMATFLAGVLADLFGKKVTLLIAGVCLSIGVIGFAASSMLPVFMAFIVLIGIGAGSLELSGSNIISSVHNKNRGKYLNLLNTFYGIGAVAASAVTGVILDNGMSWRRVYGFSLFIIVPITIYFLRMKIEKESRIKREWEQTSIEELLHIIVRKDILLMYLVVFFYVSAEIGVGTWMVNFLQREKAVSVVASSMFLSIHFIGMSAGRFFGSFFVDKIGHLKSIILFGTISAVCLVVGIFGPNNICIIIACTGFGFSVIFPTATAVISEIPVKKAGTMLGMFLSVGALGGMFGPWVTGIINDIWGLKAGMGVNAMFCVVVAASACAVSVLGSKKVNSKREMNRGDTLE